MRINECRSGQKQPTGFMIQGNVTQKDSLPVFMVFSVKLQIARDRTILTVVSRYIVLINM